MNFAADKPACAKYKMPLGKWVGATLEIIYGYPGGPEYLAWMYKQTWLSSRPKLKLAIGEYLAYRKSIPEPLKTEIDLQAFVDRVATFVIVDPKTDIEQLIEEAKKLKLAAGIYRTVMRSEQIQDAPACTVCGDITKRIKKSASFRCVNCGTTVNHDPTEYRTGTWDRCNLADIGP